MYIVCNRFVYTVTEIFMSAKILLGSDQKIIDNICELQKIRFDSFGWIYIYNRELNTFIIR